MIASYLEYLRDLETKIDQDWDKISASLEEMRKSLFSKEGCLINITSDSKNLDKSGQYISKFLDSLPSAPSMGSDPWLITQLVQIIFDTYATYLVLIAIFWTLTKINEL